MLRKIFAVILVFIVSLPTAFSGAVYVGPAISYINIRGDNRGDLRGDHVSFEGITGKLFLGFGGCVRQDIYLAAEAFITTKPAEINSSRLNIVEPGSSYGASIIPGYFLDESILAFARLGVIYTDFTRFNNNEYAYQAGVGAETHLWGPWNGRAEWIYTRYETINGFDSTGGEFSLSAVFRFPPTLWSGF